MSKTFQKIVMVIMGVIVYILLGWTIIIPVFVTKKILDLFFTRRVTPTIICDDNKYYPGLQEEPRYFMSGNNRLYGAFFSHEGHNPYKGLMIVSHGIGCSHKNYLQVIDYFTRKDYLVFSFDISGGGQSGGDRGMEGLQRAVIDLRNAILFASDQEEAKGLDLFVFGHSWSGYASACVLNDEEVARRVKAVATLAGFNRPWNVMKAQGIKKCGKIVALSRPFAFIVAQMQFGKYAKYRAMEGINKFNGPVYIAHSKDDKTVAFSNSIVIHQDECTNKLAEFYVHDGLGHTLYRPTWAEKSIDEKRAGKEPLVNKGDNIFKYFMDDRYRFSTREEVFGLNEEYMDKVEEFFQRSKGVTC